MVSGYDRAFVGGSNDLRESFKYFSPAFPYTIQPRAIIAPIAGGCLCCRAALERIRISGDQFWARSTRLRIAL
jgi:hypothetical protein